MAEERREVEITIKVQHNGYGADITAACTVDQIPGLIRRLQANDIQPANSPYVWGGKVDAETGTMVPVNGGAPRTQPVTGPAPLCPTHGVLMKPSKHRAGEFYCSAKIGADQTTGTGIYCTEKMTLTGATA